MPQRWSRDRDLALRRAAMAWLALRTNDGADWVGSDVLKEFEFEGVRVPLIDNQRGIRKPAMLTAALSIRTVYRPSGADRPYDDAIGRDGLIRYKWRGEDGDHPENRALRAAWHEELPLIWFFGVDVAQSKPIYPVFVVDEEPRLQQFVVSTAEPLAALDSPLETELARRYVVRETLQRVHQPVFRATVMRAYRTSCAVCRLGQAPLLDAAHIIGDRDDGGDAVVSNGMALCKIHHAAFDALILGVTPDYTVKIRPDLLAVPDGPMLQHGLKDCHDQPLLILPERRRERPDRDRLALRYQRFLGAS